MISEHGMRALAAAVPQCPSLWALRYLQYVFWASRPADGDDRLGEVGVLLRVVSNDYHASWFYRRDKVSSSLENQIDKAFKVNRQRSKQKGSLATNRIHATFFFRHLSVCMVTPTLPSRLGATA